MANFKRRIVKIFFLIILFGFPTCSFPFLSGDVGLMIELVSTTASQLNELEKVVTNTEKYTRKIQKYNELTQDKIFQSERILYLAEEMATRKRIKNLRDLNLVIKDLKNSIGELKQKVQELGVIETEHEKLEMEIKDRKNLLHKNESIAKIQVENSTNAKTSSRSNQLTAQNTALILENQINIQRTQLEILQEIGLTNKLMAEKFRENKIREITKINSYGIKSGK